MAERRPLSVVVPTRDRPDRLRRCLASLRAELRDDDELIVVDSASTTPETSAAARPSADRLLIAARPGASLARNLGWTVAGHPLIAFVDDDVRVTEGWADAIAAPFHDPRCAFVTGRVDVPPETGPVERPVAVKTDLTPATIDPTTTGVLGASCNLAVRRDALDTMGGFDERIGPGTWYASAEDLDLFDRLLGAGYTGRYTPDALVLHEQWRSRRDLVGLDWGYGKGMGARLARLSVRDPVRARRIAREVLWDGGVRTIARDVRAGYEFGALTVAVRTIGTVTGALRAIPTVRADGGRDR